MKSRRYFFSLILSLSLVGLVGVALVKRQAIYDWTRLRNYVPSQQIVQLATATTMNDTGKHIFYVNWPELQDKESFNASCSDSEQSIVLGCYIERQGIYLFDVTDKRLAGVEEVTAAHEMLHAAYERLTDEERQRIDQLTSDVFYKLKNDRITKTVEAYRKKDPSVVPNELHSIIATEVRDLPAELEDYYKRYFTNRLKIVELSESYEKPFIELQNQAKTYRQQLEALKVDIETRNKNLEQQALNLTTEYNDLEKRRSSAEPTSFNIQVNNYNNSVAAYNQEVELVSSLIDQYNSLLKKYNATVVEENELIKAIDSRPEAIETQ